LKFFQFFFYHEKNCAALAPCKKSLQFSLPRQHHPSAGGAVSIDIVSQATSSTFPTSPFPFWQ